jgi:hypothetical protein
MTSKNRSIWFDAASFWFVLLACLASTGCSAGEAMIDGLYGGISDTIAAVVSETILNLANR